MQPIIYDVAVSLDGYISGPGGDISQFAQQGPVVDDYLDRLGSYAVAIMGRATYEFGYGFGLRPGENPYPHMKTLVFSDTLALPPGSAVTQHGRADRQAIENVRARAEGPIYLCGGGALAGSLLSLGLIDTIRLKRAPVILGGGTRLFGAESVSPMLVHAETRQYDDGTLFQAFDIAR